MMLPENILFSKDPGKDLKFFFNRKNYSQIVVLTDENTHKNCLPVILNDLPEHRLIVVRSGEEQKTLQTCILIWEEMTDMALDRHSALVILGGGVLGDMGGFCAATYKRGIDFVLLPTTLLSQVDASIGGKLGVDFNTFKNHIGVFQNPVLTILFSGFLKTLPAMELRSGFAEVIKHCLISDLAMWNIIKTKSVNEQDWDKLLAHSVEFKARVTTEDPREKGLRKVLNAGHTIGHAVESYLLGSGNRILHGEAIAIGLIAEAWIAKERNLLKESELAEIHSYILKIFEKFNFTEEQISGSANMAVQDKKNRGNKILCVLLNGIGECQWDEEIKVDEIKRALTFYQNLQT